MPQKKIKTKARKATGPKNAPQNLRPPGTLAAVSSWKRALEAGLKDDGGFDWTTLGTVARPHQQIKARVIAKSPGVWAGDGLIAAMALVEASIQVKSRISDGELLESGQVVCEWRGPVDRILALERPFLNLAAYVGGIAFKTRTLVDCVQAALPNSRALPRVTATRKTLPGYRDLAIYGLMAGGGHSHRVSLSGGVLIKENHIAAAGGIDPAIRGAREVAPHSLKIEIEVRNEKELKQALDSGADAVLLDNFTPEQVHSALRTIARGASAGKGLRVEVSGGLSEKNIALYAIEGVHVLSVGSLTHSVNAIDLSLLVDGT